MSNDSTNGVPPEPRPESTPPAYTRPPHQPSATEQPAYPAPAEPRAYPTPGQPGYGGHSYGAPQYPDPAVPTAYPGSATPVDYAGGGSVPPSYPTYGAPSAYGGPPQPASPGPGGLAIAALVVAIVAFALGWLVVVGLLLAIVGLVLGIIAIRQRTGRGLGITAVVLSSIAALTGIGVLLFTFLFVPLAMQQAQSIGDRVEEWSEGIPDQDPWLNPENFDEEMYSLVGGQLVETQCWSYNGPAYFTNNTSPDLAAACVGALELWGEPDDDGMIIPTGVGAIHGHVGVEPVSVAVAESYVPGTDVEAVATALEDAYFADQGTIIGLHEPATLGGVPANITRVDSDAANTQTKAFITAYAPDTYGVDGEDVQLFIISIVTPYSNGDELIQQVLDSWLWH